MDCPVHNRPLLARETQYGQRYHCPESECTVVCWNGSTSTPADDETRALRQRCHATFDPLWRDRKFFQSRRAAYLWLANAMAVDEAHIGQMSVDECRMLLRKLNRLIGKENTRCTTITT